jgi:hypothetical protein
VVVSAGTNHNIINTGSVPLKLYTLYAPPNHRDGVGGVGGPEASHLWDLAIARGRLGCWLRWSGLSLRGAKQEFQGTQVVFILDLAHDLFQDVL